MLDILELIPSKDVREHIKKTGRVFTDFEKAAIIYNLKLPILERNEHLQKIADTTEDTVLRAQILEHIESDQDTIRRFKEDSNGFIYRLTTHAEEVVFFTDASLAYEAGMELGYGCFKIVKYPVAHKRESKLGPWDISATMRYLNGSLTHLTDDRYEDCCGPSRFEHAYVDIPNPFKAGDIVQNIREYHWHGVVVSPQKRREQTDADFSDIIIPIDVVQFGDVGSSYKCPLFLERYEPKADDADRDLLYEVSRLRTESDSLHRCLRAYDIYRTSYPR